MTDWSDDDAWDDESWADEPLRRTRTQRLVLAVGIVATVLLLVAGVAVGTIWWKWGQIERIPDLDLDQVLGTEPRNYLIVGSDSRASVDPSDPDAGLFLGEGQNGFGQRADTIMVIRFDEERQRLDVLSIPRDLWVPIAGRDTVDRINAAYSGEDGPNTLIRTIQEALGIPIHHYAEVDFEGFKRLVDEVGGVPMYFETIYQDRNSGFVVSNPGCVTLDGQMALAFVRARHLQYMNAAGYWETDPTGDLGRIERQQQFIRSALVRTRGLSLLDPVEYNRLLDIAVDHLRVDEDLEPTILAALGQRYAEFEGDSIETHTLPVSNFATAGGASVLQLDGVGSQPTLNIFRGEPVDAVQPQWADLTVLNGTPTDGLAASASEALRAVGFDVTATGDVPRPTGVHVERTTVRYAPGAEALAELLSSHLSAGATLEEDEALGSSAVVLEVGLDFTTVSEVPGAAPTTSGPAGGTATTTATGGGGGGAASVATPPPTTSHVGHTPGQPPEGVDCG